MPHHTLMLTISRRSTFRLGSAGLATMLAPASFLAAQGSDAETLAANKAIVQRLFAMGINLQDEDLIETIYAPDAVQRHAATRQAPGPAGMPIPLAAFRAAFPAVTATVNPIVGEGDLVAAHVVWHDTHLPTGSHVVGRSMHVFRLTGGQIAEQWSVGWDWIAPNSAQNNLPPGNPLLQP